MTHHQCPPNSETLLVLIQFLDKWLEAHGDISESAYDNAMYDAGRTFLTLAGQEDPYAMHKVFESLDEPVLLEALRRKVG